MKTEMKKKTRAQLKREAMEYLAAHVHKYHFADARIEKASTERMSGSGVILTITALGGAEIVAPILIRDGLSEATIEALRADFCRSYELATLFKPKGVGGGIRNENKADDDCPLR